MKGFGKSLVSLCQGLSFCKAILFVGLESVGRVAAAKVRASESPGAKWGFRGGRRL